MHGTESAPKRRPFVQAPVHRNHKAQHHHKKLRLKEYAEHCPYDNVVFTSLGFCVRLVISDAKCFERLSSVNL